MLLFALDAVADDSDYGNGASDTCRKAIASPTPTPDATPFDIGVVRDSQGNWQAVVTAGMVDLALPEKSNPDSAGVDPPPE